MEQSWPKEAFRYSLDCLVSAKMISKRDGVATYTLLGGIGLVKPVVQQSSLAVA